MATLFRRKKKPKTEEEQLIKDYKKVEKSTRALSNGIKAWKQSQLNLCKGTNKMSITLKRIEKIGVNPSLLVRSVDLITTYRHKMLDQVQLTTQDSIQRLHSLFSNMQEATKKRDQSKREVDQLKKKVDKYYSQYPIPIEKYKNAVKLHKESVSKQQLTHDNYINDLRIICKGKNEFFQPCLESLLLSQITLYQRIWKSIEPVIQEKEKQETLAIRPHLETIKLLDIVSGPKTDVKQKLQAKRDMETLRRQTSPNLPVASYKSKAPTPPQELTYPPEPIIYEHFLNTSPKSHKSKAPPPPPSIATIPREQPRSRTRSLKSKAPPRPISFPNPSTGSPPNNSSAGSIGSTGSTGVKRKAPSAPVIISSDTNRRGSLNIYTSSVISTNQPSPSSSYVDRSSPPGLAPCANTDSPSTSEPIYVNTISPSTSPSISPREPSPLSQIDAALSLASLGAVPDDNEEYTLVQEDDFSPDDKIIESEDQTSVPLPSNSTSSKRTPSPAPEYYAESPLLPSDFPSPLPSALSSPVPNECQESYSISVPSTEPTDSPVSSESLQLGSSSGTSSIAPSPAFSIPSSVKSAPARTGPPPSTSDSDGASSLKTESPKTKTTVAPKGMRSKRAAPPPPVRSATAPLIPTAPPPDVNIGNVSPQIRRPSQQQNSKTSIPPNQPQSSSRIFESSSSRKSQTPPSSGSSQSGRINQLG